MKAVRFDRYGGTEVLEVREVADRAPGPGEVSVSVVSAGINPGEINIREGVFAKTWPTEFPSGQGSDFAGVVEIVGPGVTGVAVGDHVIGFSDERSSHAEQVVIAADHVVAKPAGLDWDVAGALYVIGTTAVATQRSVGVRSGDTVVVAGAAGGVGHLAAQLARATGARVIGTASEANFDPLREIGVEPVQYGERQEQDIRALAPDGVDAYIDCYGSGNIDIALALGVAPERIDTIIDFANVERTGVHGDGMSIVKDVGPVLHELGERIAAGELIVPIRRRYPLDLVREAYADVATRHGLGKVVLRIAQTDI
ncbi:NADP-dependent oxidoreductase [Schumannella luteola]|uniref:NADPH:quinone reductase-like Zn-dependent oxidoreductase n=1 Tax=Schumannella luteola TaxID=472059 RepID=A0A852Y8M4_9MICO|nr:NADP-dependent oxidoreductase [Schumannella luteola]NYG99306.1 NADPH:quinone reductase-like Zn-dependent oxidoreductase [Schumannella luteola]TPX06040.1 NADP-dependent oxidoreductase [Schumannella luteola]